MKIFTLIFSIYLLAIYTLPCSDAYNISSSASHTEKHSHQTDTNDACSPFCMCQCCGIFLEVKTTDVFDFSLPYYTSTEPAVYNCGHIQGYAFDIFQPPQA